MKAIILAAGGSTRLGDITKKIPKGLLDINGKSIIQRQIDIYKKNGIDEIIIITGPNAECFKFNDVVYVPDELHDEHEVLASLMEAREFMDDDFIMSYSDIVYDENILQQMLDSKDDISIGVDFEWGKRYENRIQHPKSQADNVLVKNKKIVKIKKNISQMKNDQKIGEFIGIIKLSKNGSTYFVKKFLELKKFHKGKFQNAKSFKKAYLTDLLQELIDENIKISYQDVKGKWFEIDTPEDLTCARNSFF